MAAQELESSIELERLNHEETAADLEELLINIFTQADFNQDGVLDEQEFKELLDTSELNLTDVEKKQLLAVTDVDHDGKISYPEFVPLGADIIQTMRLRHLNADTIAYRNEVAEAQARESVHGLEEDEMTEHILQACLMQLEIRPRRGGEPVRLRAREVGIVMAYMDDNKSGVIEYREFAPRMFNWMVDALKVGFMQTQVSEIEVYLEQVELLTVLADSKFDSDDTLEYRAFLPMAAPLIQGICDPLLGYKRAEVCKRANIAPPIAGLTEEERYHFIAMVTRLFHSCDVEQTGKLDFLEFRECLEESNLGFSEKQISYLMSVTDSDEDGIIDYEEFTSLFFDALVELARTEAIEHALQTDKPAGGTLDLEQLAIPLRIAFDIVSRSEDVTEGAALAEMLETKAIQWGVTEGMEPIVAQLRSMATVSWQYLSKLLVQRSEVKELESEEIEEFEEEELPTGHIEVDF
ncbi:MAG: hypothetical protein SGPRY_006730 [Prymnesium sp.]